MSLRVVRRLTLPALLMLASTAMAAGDLRLVEAVKNKATDAVPALLKQHVNVNAAEPDGATALHWAAHWNDLETADVLIRAGANVKASNDYGVTPLWLAAVNGSAAMVDRLLKAGANPNAALPTGETVLMTAAQTGNADAVRKLLAAGANANAVESTRGQTALMWALWQKHDDVARVLIEHGADIHASSKSGSTPLMFAAREGDVEAARMLLDHGVDINQTASDGVTALHAATVKGQVDAVRFLLDRGADPNAIGPGYTPLHWASGIWETMFTYDYTVESGELSVLGGLRPAAKEAIVKALLAHGADVNARTSKSPPRYGYALFNTKLVIGATPFYLAAMAADVSTMRLLLAHGADATIGTADATTVLMVAAGRARSDSEAAIPESRVLDAVKLVLELGADINTADAQGDTTLHAATYAGLNNVVRFLVQKGAALNARNRIGNTPLKAALGWTLNGMLYSRSSTAVVLRELGGSE